MKNKIILGFALSSVMLMGGCQTPPTVAQNPGYIAKDTLDNSDPRARLVLGSNKLVGNVRMANLRFRKVGLFTQAQVGIQNLSNDRYNVEYRVEWEDKNGFMVDQSGVWRRLTLSPTQIDTFTATGKVPEAAHIVVNLRMPDDPFIINKDEKK
ncbi:MAG: DUF1425 domain-containing protein [Pseudomonadota bacterium]